MKTEYKDSLIVFKKTLKIDGRYYPIISITGSVKLEDANKIAYEGDYILYDGKLYIFRNGKVTEADENDYAKLISEIIGGEALYIDTIK